MEVGLFPLHTVLFPGRPLALHIFEPRYRLMIGRCLERSAPFGVVLIRAGLEVGEPAEPHGAGTFAEIVEHERLPDGRMHLLCIGRGRFRVGEMVPGEPYARAVVEAIVDAPPSGDVAGLTARLVAALGQYLGPEGVAGLSPPVDPSALSFAAPAALPLGLSEQQGLLEMTSVEGRLRWLIGAVERELALRERVGQTRPSHPHTVRGPSPN